MALLVALDTGASWWLSRDDHFWVTATLGYLFTIPMAIAAWSGALFKGKSGAYEGPTTSGGWLGIFLGSSAIAAIFLAIDHALVNPGFSAIFTYGALALAFISLPSAVRTWILQA